MYDLLSAIVLGVHIEGLPITLGYRNGKAKTPKTIEADFVRKLLRVTIRRDEGPSNFPDLRQLQNI